MTNLGQQRLLQEIENNLKFLSDDTLKELRTKVEVEHQRRGDASQQKEKSPSWVLLSTEEQVQKMEETAAQRIRDMR